MVYCFTKKTKTSKLINCIQGKTWMLFSVEEKAYIITIKYLSIGDLHYEKIKVSIIRLWIFK